MGEYGDVRMTEFTHDDHDETANRPGLGREQHQGEFDELKDAQAAVLTMTIRAVSP